MHRFVQALGIGAVSAVLAAGCAENESSLFIVGVEALQEPDCTASPDPGSTLQQNGVLDVAIRQQYTAALLVGNQLVQRGSADQIRTETARVTMQGAEVRVLNATGKQVDTFTIDGTGFVDPGNGGTPGYGVVFATLLPTRIARDVIASRAETTYTVRVKVFGRTLGGKDIESNELSYPITVCYGCLIDYPGEADITLGQAGYECGGSAEDIDDKPCIAGQDGRVDCRLCAAVNDDCKTPPL
jgi:hypothetical protein